MILASLRGLAVPLVLSAAAPLQGAHAVPQAARIRAETPASP